MSGVAIVRTILAANANLIAAVPATKIAAGIVPLNTVLPAISIVEIGAADRRTVAMNGAKVLITSRVQVTVVTKTYGLQKSILELVRRALPHMRGIVAGFEVDSILPDTVGPDVENPDAVVFMQTRDYIVKFLAVGA